MTNTGGRLGQVVSPDKSFILKTAPPGKDVPGATNPEQLFAAGYSSCFNAALSLILSQEHIEADSSVSAAVTLYENGPHDYYIGVAIEGQIEGLPKEKTMELLEKAHKVCPYSKAIQGNVQVTLKVMK